MLHLEAILEELMLSSEGLKLVLLVANHPKQQVENVVPVSTLRGRRFGFSVGHCEMKKKKESDR